MCVRRKAELLQKATSPCGTAAPHPCPDRHRRTSVQRGQESGMLAVKSLAAATLLVVAAVAAHAQQRPGPPPMGRPADAAIVASERALHDAAVNADRAAFASLVLPD